MIIFASEPTETQDRPAEWASPRLPYRVTIPPGWSVSETTVDDGTQTDQFSTDRDQVIGVAFGAIASAHLYAEFETAFKDSGAKIDGFDEIVVAGSPGRLYRMHRSHLFRKEERELLAIFMHRGYCWRLLMTTGDGTPPDSEAMRGFLSDFTPLEIRSAEDGPPGNVWGLAAGQCFRSLPLEVAPGELKEVWGPLDGLEPVSCDEPHTGYVAVQFIDEMPEKLEVESEDPEFGYVLCLPIEGFDHPPAGVVGTLVMVHPSGLWTGAPSDDADGS